MSQQTSVSFRYEKTIFRYQSGEQEESEESEDPQDESVFFTFTNGDLSFTIRIVNIIYGYKKLIELIDGKEIYVTFWGDDTHYFPEDACSIYSDGINVTFNQEMEFGAGSSETTVSFQSCKEAFKDFKVYLEQAQKRT